MGLYRIREDGQVVDETWLRARHHNVSMPDVLTAAAVDGVGADTIAEPASPTPGANQVAERALQLVDNQWTYVWTLRDRTPEEAAAYVAEQQAAVQNEIVQRTQERLDAFAQTRGYDGILSLCTYAASSVAQFQAEGQYGVNARDATWGTLYQVLAEIQAGTRAMPTGYADIEPDLPTLTWP